MGDKHYLYRVLKLQSSDVKFKDFSRTFKDHSFNFKDLINYFRHRFQINYENNSSCKISIVYNVHA